MIILELGLLAIGAILVIASFFLTEKLSQKDLNKMSELSEREIRTILEREMKKAEGEIQDTIDEAVDGSIMKVERSLDKETNEKIMAIHEYSDTVMQDMNKTHDEILFLYSMMNDRHDELNQKAGELNDLLKEAGAVKEQGLLAEEPQPVTVPEEPVPEEPVLTPLEEITEEVLLPPSEEKNPEPVEKDALDELMEKGLSEVEIAKQLKRGVGEVRLMMELKNRSRKEAP